MTTSIEIRCPVGPRRLLLKVLQSGERPRATSDNLLEFACYDCRRLRRRSGEEVGQVLHRYNILGELVETVVLPVSGR